VNAGYLKNGIKYLDILEVPQGSVISGILSNVYLDKLDKFMEKLLKEEFNSNSQLLTRKYFLYQKQYYNIKLLQRQYQKEPSKVILNKILKCRNKLKSIPTTIRVAERLFYTRYIDDFIIGLACTRNKAKLINFKILDFLNKVLKIQCGENNEILSFRSQKVKFLGVYIFKGTKIKSNTKISMISRSTQFKSGRFVIYKSRVISMLVKFRAPIKQIIGKLASKGFLKNYNPNKCDLGIPALISK